MHIGLDLWTREIGAARVQQMENQRDYTSDDARFMGLNKEQINLSRPDSDKSGHKITQKGIIIALQFITASIIFQAAAAFQAHCHIFIAFDFTTFFRHFN